MEIILAAGDLLALSSLNELAGQALTILYVALGLGLVIFFHELGHFAVAKWCDVHVERFSIGFGPILWSFKRGETEYALSLIPFGGYVKMLGQDDMDPSQLSSEEIAQDPRSYSAKSVPQRMGIISAGVIMNIVTGLLFFAAAFGIGVETVPAELGSIQIGSPAWVANLEPGDRITAIREVDDDDFRHVETFGDIMRGVALTDGAVVIRGVQPDGKTFQMRLQPDASGSRRIIGAGPQSGGLQVIRPKLAGARVALPGTPAARAEPAFEPGDRIRRVDDQPVSDFVALRQYLIENRDRAVVFHVQRDKAPDDDLVAIPVEPQPFRALGLWMDIGRITAVQADSPAERHGLKIDDKITRVNGKLIGTDLDPLRLPDYLGAKGAAGEEVELVVNRLVKGSSPQDVTIRLIPRDEPGWTERPLADDIPLSAPALGVAYHVIPTVLRVEPDSPAAKAGIESGERIKKVELVAPKGDEEADDDEEPPAVEFGKEEAGQKNWAFPFWLMQRVPTWHVKLTVSDKLGKERVVNVKSAPVESWFVPGVRGLQLQPDLLVQKAAGPMEAVRMGFDHTKNSTIDIYLTLRSLFTGNLSPTELSGPVQIATIAYRTAEHGISELLLFLGFLSVNLAVLNFLPIPVLDGGHMVFLIWEGVTRRKPSDKVLAVATYAGMLFVLGLMAFVLYLDLFYRR